MKDNALLTVVIPVWDRYVALIPNLVAHLRDTQELQVDLIVVDNASSIDVPPIAGVRLLRSDRRLTTGAARNLALAKVESELVSFCDADDQLLPGALNILVTRLSGAPRSIGAVASMCAYHPQRELVVPLPFPTKKALAYQDDPLRLGLSTIVKNGLPVVGPAVWRTRVVQVAGGFPDMDYCEDWALAVALAFRGPVCVSLEPLMLAQFHTGSQITLNGRPARMLAALIRLYARWYQDPCIPLGVKIILPALAIPRLRTIAKRALLRQVSHGDILDRLENPGLGLPEIR